MTTTLSARPPAGADTALALLETFTTSLLPSAVRRLSRWKGVPAGQWHDLLEDLLQELALDCLQNGREVTGLSPRARNGRWMRLLERHLYRLRIREQRRVESGIAPEKVAGGAPGVADWKVLHDLDDDERRLARGLAERGTRRKNGRLHLAESAARLGVHSRRLRQLWERIAVDLGYGHEFLAFWRRRLAEALAGLAADLLRDAGAVRIHGEHARARPDPRGRLRRIRRIQATLRVRPVPGELRSVLARVDGSSLRLEAVRHLLRAAAGLAPEDPAVHLWCFEAAVAEGDPRGAARSLRRASACGAAAVPVVLARARLLEMRGLEAAASRMLSRALQRHRADTRLVLALRGLARGAVGGRVISGRLPARRPARAPAADRHAPSSTPAGPRPRA